MKAILFVISLFLRSVYVFLELAVKVLLAFMVILIATQVTLRYFTGSSIKWAEEVSMIALVWITFLTLALGVKTDIHIRIDMFVNWIPRRGRIILEYCLNFSLLFTSLVMMIYGWQLSKFALRSTLAATRFPTTVVYGVVPLCGFICTIQMLYWLCGGKRSVTAQNYIDGVQYDENQTISQGEGA